MTIKVPKVKPLVSRKINFLKEHRKVIKKITKSLLR